MLPSATLNKQQTHSPSTSTIKAQIAMCMHACVYPSIPVELFLQADSAAAGQKKKDDWLEFKTLLISFV